jgi:tetratricopeptide (TPR) repeat protein
MLVRKGELEAAERDARKLLDRFPDAHDGYDRLGMVHETRGDKQKAAECYRKVIEVIRRQPENYEPDSEQTFAKLIDQLDSPA